MLRSLTEKISGVDKYLVSGSLRLGRVAQPLISLAPPTKWGAPMLSCSVRKGGWQAVHSQVQEV